MNGRLDGGLRFNADAAVAKKAKARSRSGAVPLQPPHVRSRWLSKIQQNTCSEGLFVQAKETGLVWKKVRPRMGGKEPVLGRATVRKELVLDDSAPAPDLPPSSPLAHGGRVLPAVTVDAYNEELRDDEGFVGDRASRRAFRAILADWRDRLKEHGDDPFGDVPMEEISKSKLDKMMAGDDPVAAGLVHTIIEEFAGELATVVRRFLRLESWKGTERIVLGGGLIASRIGELAMGRASIILSAAGAGVELRSIENHPDEAGLIGAVQLAPTWIMAGHDAILAVDIGGTNARVGIVELNAGKAAMYRRPTSGSANTGDTSTTSPSAIRRSSALPRCWPSSSTAPPRKS